MELHSKRSLLGWQLRMPTQAHAARAALHEVRVPKGHVHEVDASDVAELDALACLRGLGAHHTEALSPEVPLGVVEVPELLHGRDAEARLLARPPEDLQHSAEAHLAREHHHALFLALRHGLHHGVHLGGVALDVRQQPCTVHTVVGTVVHVHVAIVGQTCHSFLLGQPQQPRNDLKLDLLHDVALQGLAVQGVAPHEVVGHSLVDDAVRDARDGHLAREVLAAPCMEGGDETLVVEVGGCLALDDV
mmetsp:Transcript_160555/g.515383  ORF Transcript_160555/g.515383 Transcript_160555/m.515383 type:complete len:247 (+) Transcript_160555:841-1581(+)